MDHQQLVAAARSTQDTRNPASFYRQFHDKHPGITEHIVGSLPTSLGVTVYQFLADAVPNLKGKSVLDLACGSGELTRIVAERIGPTGSLVGLDVSQAELDLARVKLRGHDARLVRGTAQELSEPSSAFDVVFCCIAFNLFAPIEPVIHQTFRVLRPDGIFAIVVGSIGDDYPEYRAICNAINESVVENIPNYTDLLCDDIRTEGRESLIEIVVPPFIYQEDVAFAILMNGSPDELSFVVPDYFYKFHLLTEAAKRDCRKKVRLIAEQHQSASGRACFRIPYRRFVFNKH